jgi:hypothetical protein
MPLDFAAAICESETAAAGVLVDAFFVEPLAEVELGAEVAGAEGALAAGAALALLPDVLLELLAAALELSAVVAPASAVLDSALFFLLLLAPGVLGLADSLPGSEELAALVSDFLLFLLLLLAPAVPVLAVSLVGSEEVAAVVSDFLLFLLLLFVEPLPVVSELAELSGVAESDFLDFVLLFEELEPPLVLVLLVVSSEVDFVFFFLLLVEVVP